MCTAYLAFGSTAHSHIQASSADELQIIHLSFKGTSIYTSFLSTINSDGIWIIPKMSDEAVCWETSSLFIKGLKCCLMFEESQSHLSLGKVVNPNRKSDSDQSIRMGFE